MSPFRVSIIIPTYNNAHLTLACLQSILAHTPAGSYEVVLVDNASQDDTGVLLDAIEGDDVQIIRNATNLGFARACNQGAAVARGRHLLFLNNDTEVRAGWLDPLVRRLDRDLLTGVVGARLLFPDGTLQHAGVEMVEERRPDGSVILYGIHRWYRQPGDFAPALVAEYVPAVTGACLAIRRRDFDAVGGWDEGYWNGNEDVELCLAVRATGRRIAYEPASVVVHHESVSGPERFSRVDDNVRRLTERWFGRVPVTFVIEDGVARRVGAA